MFKRLLLEELHLSSEQKTALRSLTKKQREAALAWFDCERYRGKGEGYRDAVAKLKTMWRRDTIRKDNRLDSDSFLDKALSPKIPPIR